MASEYIEYSAQDIWTLLLCYFGVLHT